MHHLMKQVSRYSLTAGNRRRRTNYGDEDELAQEQEERRHRQQLNKEFSQFSDRIAETSKKGFEIDIPQRELGFDGKISTTLIIRCPGSSIGQNATDD